MCSDWINSFPEIVFRYAWNPDTAGPGDSQESYDLLPEDVKIDLSDEVDMKLRQCVRDYIYDIITRQNRGIINPILPSDVKEIEVFLELGNAKKKDGTPAEQTGRPPDFYGDPIIINSVFKDHLYSVYLIMINVVMNDENKNFFETGTFKCKQYALKMYGHRNRIGISGGSIKSSYSKKVRKCKRMSKKKKIRKSKRMTKSKRVTKSK